MHKNLLKTLFLLYFFSFNTYLLSTVPPKFSIKTLNIKGVAIELIIDDIDGDGAEDILAVSSLSHFPASRSERIISLFKQKAGTFHLSPDATRSLDWEEVIFDIGDIDNDRIKELLFIKRDGVYFNKPCDLKTGKRARLLIKTNSLITSSDPSRIFRYHFIRDLDCDGRDEILIPQPEQFYVFSQSGKNVYTLTQRLWISPEFIIDKNEGVKFLYTLPNLIQADFNGDGRSDMLVINSEQIDIFLHQIPDTSINIIPLTPPLYRYWMGMKNVHSSVFESAAPPSVSIEPVDLDGNGYVDVVVSRAARGGFTKNISQIQIYMNRSGHYDTNPNHILTAENFNGEHIICDFNRDGLLDIGLLTLRTGFIHTAEFLLTKKVGYKYQFYLMREDRTFPKIPDGSISFSRRVSIADIMNASLLSSTDGDFNGDGIKDLIVPTDENEFTIFPGDERKIFTKKNSIKIEVHLSNHFCITDLNNDGISDIILWYTESKTMGDKIVLIQSKVGDYR